MEVVFKVPSDFDLPKFYEIAPEDAISLALRLGALAVETMYNSIADEVRQECNSEVVAKLEKKHMKREEDLEREKRVIEETLKHAQAKLMLDDQLKTTLRQQVQDETRNFYRELLDEKDKQIHQLREQLHTEMRSLNDRFSTMKDSVSRQLGSQEKGKVGEVSMEELIKKAFGGVKGFDLQSVGKEAQRGDHLMIYNTLNVLWEIKNYSRMVNKDEVEKLHRDMRSNPDIRLAFMVSLQSGIVGHNKSGDIDLEVLEDGRFIVYLCNLYRHEDVVLYLQTMRPILELLESQKDAKVQNESETLSKLRYKAKIVHHLLLNHKTTLLGIHNALVNQKKKTDQMNAELLASIKQAESECTNSIRELLSESTEEGSAEPGLNPEIYTKIVPLDLTDKEKKLVDWLQKYCEEDSDAEIESKVFLEKIKGVFKSDKELREAREILQESVWPKQGKKIRGFRLKD
jgi:hypothetical protein